MDHRAPSRIIASCFALSAFAIALISGLVAQRSSAAILSTAVFALLICYILGLIIAAVANVAVSERIHTINTSTPVPTPPDRFTPHQDEPSNQSTQAA